MFSRSITFLLFFNLNVYAQPVIDYNDFFDFKKYYTKTEYWAPSIVISMANPDTGNNVFWDYSVIKEAPDLLTYYDTLYFVDPVNTPFYNETKVNYKRSNVCFVESDSHSPFGNFKYYYYYSANPDVINFIGSWEDSPHNERYWYDLSDLRIDYKFPLFYSLNVNDDYIASFVDAAAGLRIYQSGKSWITCDAYGTLVTPSKDTLANALKMTQSTIYKDSSNNYSYNSEYKNHIWFSRERHGPILIIRVSNGFVNSIKEYKEINATNIKAENEIFLQSEFSIYPNPVISGASISLPNNATLKVLVYNILGQVVRSYTTINNNILSFQRDDMPNGIYILRVIDKNKILATKKFLLVQ